MRRIAVTLSLGCTNGIEYAYQAVQRKVLFVLLRFGGSGRRSSGERYVESERSYSAEPVFEFKTKNNQKLNVHYFTEHETGWKLFQYPNSNYKEDEWGKRK